MAQELYTSCTACEAVFEITLEQLGLANGAVRCGVCGETFNARESLREVVPETAPAPAPADAQDVTLPAEGVPDEEPLSRRQDTGDFELEISTDSPDPVDEQLVALDLLDETVALEGPTAGDGAADDAQDIDGLLGANKAPGPGLLSNLVWGTLGLAMLVLALGQAAVYWRDRWIQVPWLNPPLLALNERLGTPIEFTYDVGRYRFVDRPRLLVDANDDPQAAQVLQVQAEVANDAAVPQPLPHLRLILEDRWGRPVASRTLTPNEYLPRNRSDTQFLQPEEQIRAAARVSTEHAAPEAYTLDICLPIGGERLDCGNPPTQR